jgi:hypothetical protein
VDLVNLGLRVDRDGGADADRVVDDGHVELGAGDAVAAGAGRGGTGVRHGTKISGFSGPGPVFGSKMWKNE